MRMKWEWASRGVGMRKTEQGMGMTDQGMVVEHGNELCGEGEMGKAEQVMEMAEHGTMAQHG
jgi:hypothetical protein